MSKHILSDKLTWNEVADIYDKHCGGTARTLQMNNVFDAVAKLSFIHLDEEGYLHLILNQEQKENKEKDGK